MLIDADPQASLTISLGVDNPDSLESGLQELMDRIINDKPFDDLNCIIKHEEGVDLVPSNISLSNTDLKLTNVMIRINKDRHYFNPEWQIENVLSIEGYTEICRLGCY